jgi:glucokinase
MDTKQVRTFLAGDIGGTSTRLALYQQEGQTFSRILTKHFRSDKDSSLESIIREFMTPDLPQPDAACFGVPGPVSQGNVTTTNLPWTLSEEELKARLAIPKVRLVNDLAAVAAVIPFLSEKEVITLHPGIPSRNKSVSAIVAPGTGLGQSMVYVDEAGLSHTLSSEGGHVDFAPRTDLEWRLVQYLLRTLQRVSIERLLSGPGIYNIYKFLSDEKYEPETPTVIERMKSEDPPKVIAEAALRNECGLCVRTLELFSCVLGSHAGNVMLSAMATGGVYIGGGIPPKVVSFLQHPRVIEAYTFKGRLSSLVKATPLVVIKDDQTGLHGAARIASMLR